MVQHPAWPSLLPQVLFQGWQKENCSGEAVAGDGLWWGQKAAGPEDSWVPQNADLSSDFKALF